MSKKISYLLTADKLAERNWPKVKSEDLSLTGLWLWAKSVHKHGKKADIKVVIDKDELEQWDVIGLNLTPGNLEFPQVLREALGENSSTKLVINCDFEIDNWDRIWMFPNIFAQAMNYADIVFHVEPVGSAALEHILKRKVFWIPHPCDLEGLDKLKKKEREPTVVTVYHRHTGEISFPYWAQKDLPLYRIQLGYAKGKVPASSMYHMVTPYIKFRDAMEIMSKAKFGFYCHQGYTVGRPLMEFAAMAIPCVCSKTMEACRRCFPSLATEVFDIKAQHDILEDLIDHDEKYNEAYKYAYEAVSYYSLENSYKRLCKAVEECEDEEGK